MQPTGAKSFATVTLGPDGKQIWTTIGSCDLLGIDQARGKAREAIQRVRAGLPAFETLKKRETFLDVAEQWLKRHVLARGLRSGADIERLLKIHIYAAWGEREFLSIRRSDVAELLDEIQDDHGARQADAVLAIVRGLMNWYASRHDNYVPPIVRGMNRTSPKQRERTRILDDDELRAVWMAGAAGGTFGAFIQMLLLTAQRRAKVVAMRFDHVRDGTWAIPAEEREKGNAGELVLPAAAIAIIERQPRLGENPFVFAGRGDVHISGFSKSKRAFDATLPKNMPQWGLHDLRRTARSLMARAGVRPEVAERVLGHVLAGVEGVYDRHSYSDEKSDAVRRLASLIDGIVNPRENVTAMKRAAR